MKDDYKIDECIKMGYGTIFMCRRRRKWEMNNKSK
jgi:hypothetical protein